MPYMDAQVTAQEARPKYNGGSSVVYTMQALPTLFPTVLQKRKTEKRKSALLSSSLCHSKSSCPGQPIVLFH